MITPAERAEQALAEVAALIRDSPPLIEVMEWHERLCGACEPLHTCPERAEIIEEYGAGTYGITAFFP